MGRFAEPQDPAFHALNRSLDVDRRLWPHDVAQSHAHVGMLAAQGVIPQADAQAIHLALDQVELELAEDRFPFEEADEDIHMAVERRLTAIAGDAAKRVHTARSRNDQVATDVAMFCRDTACDLERGVADLMRALVAAAEAHVDAPLPGYTHLQRAQPVYLGHHLLAYVWMLERDRARLRFAAEQANTLPLGAGALAGVSFATDRRAVADALGFARVAPNSIDAVSNRDFVLDLLHACAVCATHLSRLGAELVLWTSEEFGFAVLPDAWSSGSSIMPQKKNPDAAELLRAKAPRVVGRLAALHGVLHALPLTYNKDMQEDKEHLFDAVDTLALVLRAATGMLEGIRFRPERMAAAASDELIAATDLADWLVKRGTPFRDAHGVVGGLVRTAVEGGRPLSEVAAAELGDDVAPIFEQRSWLESKESEGGTALARVREQLEQARALLA
jgi:argininosuccinate lyase